MVEYLRDKLKKTELELYIIDKLKNVKVSDFYSNMEVVGIDILTCYDDLVPYVSFYITFRDEQYVNETGIDGPTEFTYLTKCLQISQDLRVVRTKWTDDGLVEEDEYKAELKPYNDILDGFKNTKNLLNII
jgi:hypothetical protein